MYTITTNLNLKDEKQLKEKVVTTLLAAKEVLGQENKEETVFPSGIRLPPRPEIRPPGPVESKLLYSSYLQQEQQNLEVWYIEYYNIIETIDEGFKQAEQLIGIAEIESAKSESNTPSQKTEDDVDGIKHKFDIITAALSNDEVSEDKSKDEAGALGFGGRWRDDETEDKEAEQVYVPPHIKGIY